MVPAVSMLVGVPEITPVVLLTSSPSGRDGAQTSTKSCPLNVGVIDTESPWMETTALES